jgi:WD40 repeat protein
MLSYDLTGALGARFANAPRGKVSVFSDAGFRPMPALSSRATFAFSPDGQRLATASPAFENAAVWDVATGRRLFSLTGPTNTVHDVAFSGDGRWIAAACGDGTARVWDGGDGRAVAILQPHAREVTKVVFSRDPRWLLTACADNRLRLWDVENKICVALLRGHRDQIRSVEFSPDGEEVVSASADRTVRRWRWATFEQMAVSLPPHSDDVKAIHFSSDGQRVVTCSADREAFVCDANRRKLLLNLHRKKESVGPMAMTVRANSGGEMCEAAFAPGDEKIVTVCSDPIVSVNRNPLATVWPRLFVPKPKPFTPGSVWDAKTGRELVSVPGNAVAFVGVEFSPDGKRALLRGDEFPRSVTERGWGKWSEGSYSHGGKRIAEAVLWDLEKAQEVRLLDAGPHTLLIGAFNSKDGRILTASHSLVQIWSADGLAPQEIADARGRDWTAYSLSGALLISEDENGFPALWDTKTLKKRRAFEAVGTNVWEAWLAGGEREVGIITEDGHLKTFDGMTGALLWEGHGSGRNTGLTVASPDGKWLATVIDKHQIDLWDLEQHQLARFIERHLYSVTALGFSPDGQWLGTGDSSGESWLWPLRLAKIPAEPDRRADAGAK